MHNAVLKVNLVPGNELFIRERGLIALVRKGNISIPEPVSVDIGSFSY